MKAWKFFVDKLYGLTKIMTFIGFVALFICVMLQIICRYVLEIPLPWSDELARYLLVWVSLLAVSIAFRNDSNIRLDFFISQCPPLIRHGVWVLFNLLTLAFLGLLVYYGIPNATIGKFTCSPGLTSCFPNTSISMFLPYLSVPVAAGLMIINLIDYIMHNFKTKEMGDTRDT